MTITCKLVLFLLLLTLSSSFTFRPLSTFFDAKKSSVLPMNVKDVEQKSESSGDAGKGKKLLPSSDPNSDIPKLQFGETLKLDFLGPIIINTDGTTKRIANWDALTEKEKEVSWRRIGKRNEERKKILSQEQLGMNE